MVVKPFPESKIWHKAGGVSRLNKKALSALISSNVTVFAHDFGNYASCLHNKRSMELT